MLSSDAEAPASTALMDGIRSWLTSRGLDPDDARLADTPRRVQRVLDSLTAGYDEDPEVHLCRTFAAEDHQGMIAVKDVVFASICERHLLPFSGRATIAYVPVSGAPVVGLSKLPRVLEIYARRLQRQQRLTRQVTDAIDRHLKTEGSACVIRARHACLGQESVTGRETEVVTTSFTGCFDTDPALRAELYGF